MIAKCYGNFNTNSAISSGDVRFTNGITIASTNPDGGSMLYIAQSIDHNFSDSNYKYVYYTDDSDTVKLNIAKELIEGADYTMTQVTANTVTDVKTELLSQIISLTGMDETGVVISEADIAISEFEAAEAGTSANPAGESGSFRFTVYLSKGAINFSTISITGAITATAYTGLTDAQAVAAAKTAIVGGTVTVDHGADQIAKVAAVQSYVNSLLTGDAAGVTAVVSFISDNTYIVELTLGSIVDSKSITMTIYENELPTPTPTPTPAPEVNVTVTGDYIRFGIKLTPDTIEYYNGQINIPITSRELMIELAKKEGPGVSVMVNLPELSDEVNQAEINLILRSEIIKLAKENGKSISVDVVDSDNNILYSWTFDSEGLADSDKEIKDVNLSLKVDKAPEDAPFADDQKDNEDSEDAVTLVIDFAHNGLLPTQASVRVYVGHME